MIKLENCILTNCTLISENNPSCNHHQQSNKGRKGDSQCKKQKIRFYRDLLGQLKIWKILIVSFIALYSDNVPNEYTFICSLSNCNINYCITVHPTNTILDRSAQF